MRKIAFLLMAVAFVAFANAEEIILNPQGWKVGDSRNYNSVFVDKKGEITNGTIVMSVSAIENDKYLLDYKNITDTTNNIFKSLTKLVGDSVCAALNDFVYKISITKMGEFGHFENYEDFNNLFNKNTLIAMGMQAVIGSTQEDAETKYVPELQNIFWYMNKKFDTKKENVFKRNLTEEVAVYKDVETKVNLKVSNGKVTFKQTATLSEEDFYTATEKIVKERMNEMAKVMGVQPSMFDEKIKETLDYLKENPVSMVFKETSVFDEKSGWLISTDKVAEIISASTEKTSINSRYTISLKK